MKIKDLTQRHLLPTRLAWVMTLALMTTLFAPGRSSAVDDMAFSVEIKPTGAASFDFKLQNDSRENVTAITLESDSGVQKFEAIYSGSLTKSARVLEPPYGALKEGLVREVWNNINGSYVANLTSNARYPNSPDSRSVITGGFTVPNNFGDNYGQRVHGFFRAPQSGTYTFALTSDDEGILYIAPITQMGNLTRIVTANVNTQVGTVTLTAGQWYYLVALMKEIGGLDYLIVSWKLPNEVIQDPIPANIFRYEAEGYILPSSDPSAAGTATSTIRLLDIDNLTMGNTISFKALFTTPHPANAAQLLWNNGIKQNAKITVFGANGGRGELTLPDTASNESGKTYTFTSGTRPRSLKVSSRVTGTSRMITNFTVRVLNNQGAVLAEHDHPPGDVNVNFLTDGMRVEIAAVGDVYMGGNGNFLYDSRAIPPEGALDPFNPPRQRFVPIGISVNNSPQTGDPTQYIFDIDGDADVTLRWRQDYALTVNHDFSMTASEERDKQGNPWAGPLASKASGNPTPDSTKTHWIARGDQVIAQVDGQVLDFSRPGLDIRYVPIGYKARGSARGVYKDNSEVYEGSFLVGQSPAQRQQVDSFIMDDWATIDYIWRIQFGVKVNVDDPTRSSLPRVFRVEAGSGQEEEVGSLEGTFWFDPGASIKVGSAANITVNPTSLALSGWISGDSFYFSQMGEINTQNGQLSSGGPLMEDDGPVANWTPTFFDSNGRLYRGLNIPHLRRPARVLWSYGSQVFEDTVTLGESVFQRNQELLVAYPQLATAVLKEPDAIGMLQVDASNQLVGDNDMAIWDGNALRLYPLIPGKFRATWSTPQGTFHVIVTVKRPAIAHYPHVASSPPVELNPDPEGVFHFRELKYSENEAALANGSQFVADKPGISVLLFTQIERIGRGEPKEYLRVRMVETKTWDDPSMPQATTAIIGQRIADDQFDKARLGTGHLHFSGGRYNANIYDAVKLDGIRSRDVYDMTQLRSVRATKVIANPAALPGPIIPVNLHPGAKPTERLVVTWYQNPTLTDEILWPAFTRTYLPRWPQSAAEGLGRIVIASQLGSDSLGRDGLDQLVAAAVTNSVPDGTGGTTLSVTPVATTYDPARIQQPAIYVQNNPTLPGYNPNEEHALMAPSRRFAQVAPRPPAAYALRVNDLNRYTANSVGEANQPSDYTSHPYVLVQYFDSAVREFRMRVYTVERDDAARATYQFANQSTFKSLPVTATAQALNQMPHITMIAGEPVIPFYPLGVAIGATPMPESYGENIKRQATCWEDHKGTAWAVSGGAEAWFTYSIHYPLAPDFWWPEGKPGRIRYDESTQKRLALVPNIGDSIAFLPVDSALLRALTPGAPVNTSIEAAAQPIKILYKSDWPAVAPLLKAGETLTFAGGEYRQDHATTQVIGSDGRPQTIQTPGLPGVLAFATGEVVFDMLNPYGQTDLLKTSWTVRMGQALEARTQPLAIGNFPTELLPASGKSRVSGGKYVFNDLPASLQRRFRYDPTAQMVDAATGITVSGRLELGGRVNDKAPGDATLTAAPAAVYLLEPNIMSHAERDALLDLSENISWRGAVQALYQTTRNPTALQNAAGQPLQNEYLVGLQPRVQRNPITGLPLKKPIELGSAVLIDQTDPKVMEPARQFGPGLALIPNAGFLDPAGVIPGVGEYPAVSWVTVAENNDPSMGGSPVTLHVIKVDRRERYRGAVKTVLSDNVFDENIELRHTGDFGGNADDLVFEWWYRPDDGSLNVMPPYIVNRDSAGPWALFPDLSGQQGLGRFGILLKGNPNAPEVLLADSWWHVRYRHRHDVVADTDWYVKQPNLDEKVNFEWAGAGNNDPLHDFDLDGYPDYRAQLAMGWIKRVIDAVNPYEARIRDFEGESPSTVSSMLRQFGSRYEGPVALNPDKDVIENVGLIALYETILKRAQDLSINLSSPVSTPAIANALQLASTRLSDFYTLLGNEAYVDARDPTIGIGSGSVEYGSLAPAVFAFQNQVSSLNEEELALLRGQDDYLATPVYNRLFWNFTKGEGEAAYAVNYNISDVNADGFINEEDAMALYPQGHGDAWGHYLTALTRQYDLLRHPYFNWVSRAEFYNLMDVIVKVDFLDERKFAQVAAAKARAGAEIVTATYRDHYVEDTSAQWQGYSDVNPDRAWGVQEWARRAGQGAYFDWITANALLPSQHPNETLEGIQKVDRQSNDDIKVISAMLSSIQQTFDDANSGLNPLRLSPNAVPFDVNPEQLADIAQGRSYFEQVYDRAVEALKNATAVWDNANKSQNRLRQIANNEAEFRQQVFEENLAYRNRLIEIFGRPYDGTVGAGKMYPAGYDGPDLALYMYVNVREINDQTVPGPSKEFATFNDSGQLTSGDLYKAYEEGEGGKSVKKLNEKMLQTFAPSLASDDGSVPILARDGFYSVNYTDLNNPKVPLENLAQLMPIKAAGYTFQAPTAWGARPAVGELQTIINEMVQQEANIAAAIANWDSVSGDIVAGMRAANAKIKSLEYVLNAHLGWQISKMIIGNIIAGANGVYDIIEATKETITTTLDAAGTSLPANLPTGGLAISPGDALAPARGGLKMVSIAATEGIGVAQIVLRSIILAQQISFDLIEQSVELAVEAEEVQQAKRELLSELDSTMGNEPMARIAVFKEIEALRALSDRYRSVIAEGARLVDERAAFNKRVAAMTQQNRYQDMTFRVHRNHALEVYNQTFDVAARYAYLAAKAYDYETNLDPIDAGSPSALYTAIVKARTLGQVVDGTPQLGEGGLADALARLRINYEALKGQLGFNNPQRETGKMSLRTELFRILPSGAQQPQGGHFPGGGQASDALWRQTLLNARVANLWEVPEYRYFARPFAADIQPDGTAAVEPGLVLRFSTSILAGQNVFGKPLSGGDHAYDPSVFATKIRGVGVWFANYLSEDVLNDLPQAPRVYLFPVGADVMSIANSATPDKVRLWNVIDQQIPVPLPSVNSALDRSGFIPLLDSLNGRLGNPRRFSSFRAYHDSGSEIDMNEIVLDTRLVGRSVWNTQWVLIIPGLTLNSNPNEGLNRFINQVTDIKLLFETYGHSGN